MKTNELIERNLHLVKIAVKSNINKPPFCYMEPDELVAAGNLGLVKAAHNYNTGDTPFPAYALLRIVGEMRDMERKMKWGKTRNRCGVEPLKDDRPSKPSYDVDGFYEQITRPLNHTMKQAFVWHYRDHCTMMEIAQRLGMGQWGEARVSKLLARSKDLIRETYESHELFSALTK